MNKIQNKKAFTLVELLIVITIIGILFVVLISRVDFARDKAKTTGVNTDFREYEIAFQTAAGNGQGFDPLYVFTPESISTTGADTSKKEKMVKEAASAADNLLAAINKNLDDAMQLKLAFGYSAHNSDGTYVGSNKGADTDSVNNQVKTADLVLIDLGITLDFKDDANAGNGVGCVFVTDKLDPWNEQYIVYYVQGQMETVTIGEGDNEKVVVRNVADGTIHGNRGCLCMISKGIDVDEMLVWDDTAIDTAVNATNAFAWKNGNGGIGNGPKGDADKTVKPGEWQTQHLPAYDAAAPTWTGDAKYGTPDKAATLAADKYLYSGSFVPAKGSDDLVLCVSYSFASGRGVAVIQTFGFEENID